MTWPLVVSVEIACERCSLPIIGRHGRGSSPSSAPASTVSVTGLVGAAAGVAETAGDTGPSMFTSDSDDTVYQRCRPGSPVVSTYGGWGTASTSRPAWSSGSQGPSTASPTCTW
jgi:hypothetical protein